MKLFSRKVCLQPKLGQRNMLQLPKFQMRNYQLRTISEVSMIMISQHLLETRVTVDLVTLLDLSKLSRPVLDSKLVKKYQNSQHNKFLAATSLTKVAKVDGLT